jgi:hypothetical protein
MEGRAGHGESAAASDGREQAADARDDAADAREDAADAREREHDIREGVLDRWERELTEQANSLQVLDVDDDAARQLARRERAQAHRRRRADAEQRHAAAIERAVERSGTGHGGDTAQHTDAKNQRALDRLAALVVSSGTLSETLTTILAIATDSFAEAAAVTVALAIEGKLEPAASTAPWATELDTLQIREHAGPIADAVNSRTVVVTADLSTDQRWQLGKWTGRAGNRGAISAAIVLGDSVSGVVTAYAEPARRFDSDAVLTAGLLATQASLAVGWHLERVGHRAQNEAWERALTSRDQIGQAKGILMEQNKLTAEQAFDLLRVTSQHHNTKVRDVAEHVVTHRRLPDPP